MAKRGGDGSQPLLGAESSPSLLAGSRAEVSKRLKERAESSTDFDDFDPSSRRASIHDGKDKKGAKL